MGRILGTLHQLHPASSPLGDLLPALPHRLPHALLLHRPDYAFYCNASPSCLQAVQFMQSFPEFGRLVDKLAAEWLPTCLIHSDVKGDNILLSTNRSGRSVWLLDWELAALGDAAWDVGSMLADYLGVWLSSIPIVGDRAPADYLSLARFPLIKVQPAIRAFWASYRVTRGLSGIGAAQFLLAATRYSAVRLIQRVHEQARDTNDLTAALICQLQLSWNVLREPELACAQLLGIDLMSEDM